MGLGGMIGGGQQPWWSGVGSSGAWRLETSWLLRAWFGGDPGSLFPDRGRHSPSFRSRSHASQPPGREGAVLVWTEVGRSLTAS